MKHKSFCTMGNSHTGNCGELVKGTRLGVAEGLPSIFNLEFVYDEGALTAQLRFLLGRILTIIDASIPDSEQKKAIKDLITVQIWERRDWILSTATKEGVGKDSVGSK